MAVACNLGDQQVRRHQCAPLQRLRQRQSAPAVCAEPLERLESRLVGHLAATLDPVAKVDMRRLRLLCCLAQRKHDKGAERESGLVWVEEAVERGRSIAKTVEQANRHQTARPCANIGKACVDTAGLTISQYYRSALPANTPS